PEPTRVKKNGKKVAIVGSGPSGLTTAGDLIQQGYEVTVFEAFHLGGGVLVYGIPEFRLPKSVVSYEIQNLENSGVRFEYDSVIGRARSISELFSEDGFDAVYIGVGAGLPVFMNIPGENLQGVYSANEYLTRSNLMKAYLYPEYNTPLLKGKNVVVVGGGNVAMDSARTALRLDADNVYIVYRRARDQMPARGEEIHHAEEEGIQFKLLSNPVEIFGDEYGRVNKVKCQRYELGEPDKSGRARPVPIDGSYFDLDTDLIIIAIGNKANPLITNTTPDLEVNKWGNVATDDMGRTSIPFVYAGGDIVTGAATVISAMGAGRNAATAIHEDLFEGEEEEKIPEKLSFPKGILDLKHAAIYPNTTILKLNLINVSDKELTQVKIRVSHVQDFFEETLFETIIPRWPPSEEYEIECPRYHAQEKEYLLTIKDMNEKIMSKVIIASEVMK
ncbi:MAG: FAD-dependent oxidoreductase, partial [Candidatus Hodarchaeales archaeon]